MNFKNNPNAFLIEKLINDKEITFQKFFDLDEIPENIKKLESSTKLIRGLRYKIKDIESDSNDVIKCCDRDELSDAQKSAINLNDAVSDINYYVDELEKNIEQWEYAYNDLKKLILDILNSENIDLTKYSNNFSESEQRSYHRIKIINQVLEDDED